MAQGKAVDNEATLGNHQLCQRMENMSPFIWPPLPRGVTEVAWLGKSATDLQAESGSVWTPL
jgi:hypothetical protein